jgi:uncharacterized protein YjbI with pentapeptide repeats
VGIGLASLAVGLAGLSSIAVADTPIAPYPPDIPPGAKPASELAELEDVIAEDADWANSSASGLVVRRAELHRCRLTGAELRESTFVDVTFDGCRLDLAGLRRVTMERVVFRDCRMAETDLTAASLKDVLLERCDLRQAVFRELQLSRVELRRCALDAIDGAEALRGARMTWSDVVEHGYVFAAALGIEIVDEETD